MLNLNLNSATIKLINYINQEKINKKEKLLKCTV